MPPARNDFRDRLEPVWSRVEPVWRWFEPRADLVLALTLALVAAFVGGVVVSKVGQGSFYQGEFSPAVMRACGNGFESYRPEPGDQLERFLTIERDSFDCAELDDPERSYELNAFSSAHRYLLETAAFLWRVQDVSWGALVPLFAALYGLAALGLYGLFRLVAGRVLATLGTLVLTISPEQAEMLRNLRDYAKAPFLICSFFLVALYAAERLRPRQAILLGAAGGLFAGIGFGFRADVLIVVPMLVASVAFFWRNGIRSDIRVRLATLAAFTATFAVAAAPIVFSYASGGNLFLMGIHGQSVYFNGPLGVQQDLYNVGYLYNDPYAISLVNAHDLLVDGNKRALGLAQPELDEASASMYRAIATNLPADFAVRSYAAILTVLDYAPSSLGTSVTAELDPGGTRTGVRELLRRLLAPFGDGWVLVALALVVGVLRNFRLALGAFLAVGYLGALNAFQPSARHWFYLEFVWWLAVAFLLHALVQALVWAWRRRGGRADVHVPRPVLVRAATRLGIAGLVTLVTIVLPLAAARAYQERHVETILERYEAAPRRELDRLPVAVGNGRTLFTVPDESPAWSEAGGFRTALFVLTFGGGECDYPQLRPVARYRAATPFEDWSTELDVRLVGDASSVEVYLLAFQHPTTGLIGFELAEEAAPCLERIEAISHTTGFPLLLNATLPRDWREATRYQTMNWEDRRGVYDGAPYVMATTDRLFSTAELRGGTAISGQVWSWLEGGVEQLGDTGWKFSGTPASRYSYLAVGEPVELRWRESVVVRGRIERGGVQLGLQAEEAWTAQTSALQPGAFWAVIEAPADGTYSLVIANNLQNDSGGQDVVIEDVRRLPPPPG
jgi:hypothetical protein